MGVKFSLKKCHGTRLFQHILAKRGSTAVLEALLQGLLLFACLNLLTKGPLPCALLFIPM
jgi:hypothetical protein